LLVVAALVAAIPALAHSWWTIIVMCLEHRQ